MRRIRAWLQSGTLSALPMAGPMYSDAISCVPGGPRVQLVSCMDSLPRSPTTGAQAESSWKLDSTAPLCMRPRWPEGDVEVLREGSCCPVLRLRACVRGGRRPAPPSRVLTIYYSSLIITVDDPAPLLASVCLLPKATTPVLLSTRTHARSPALLTQVQMTAHRKLTVIVGDLVRVFLDDIRVGDEATDMFGPMITLIRVRPWLSPI